MLATEKTSSYTTAGNTIKPEPETMSMNSESTTNTSMDAERQDDKNKSTNNSISLNKLLEKKQQDQLTKRKQTPLEEYLDKYAMTLDNKSPSELDSEREKLEWRKKMSLIASIIFAILALIVLITACIFLPLMAALAIAIPCAIGAITAIASGIIDYNIINKQIDRVNSKKSQLSLQEKTQLRGNNKSKINNLDTSVQKNNTNTNNINNSTENNKISGQGNNIDNKKHSSSHKEAIENGDSISIQSNKNDNNPNKETDKIIKMPNKGNNNKENTVISSSSATSKSSRRYDEKNDQDCAERIRKDTLTKILTGTLNLSSNRPKNEEEYKKCRDAAKNAKTQTERAKSQQQMIKYEIWSQLTPEQQQRYTEIAKKYPNNTIINKNNDNWQVNLYHQHLENEEQKNQSFIGTICSAFKGKKNLEEKRKAIEQAIFSEPQQQKNMQISGVDATKGDNNYKSGAIKNKDMTIKVNQK